MARYLDTFTQSHARLSSISIAITPITIRKSVFFHISHNLLVRTLGLDMSKIMASKTSHRFLCIMINISYKTRFHVWGLASDFDELTLGPTPHVASRWTIDWSSFSKLTISPPLVLTDTYSHMSKLLQLGHIWDIISNSSKLSSDSLLLSSSTT